MASEIENIYLLREAVHFGKIKQDELLLLNIDLLKENLYTILINKIGLKQLTKTMVVNDYIVLCFLIGNDFLPHLPGISIKSKGIELLLDIYIKCIIKKKECLVYDGELNLMFLKDILVELSKLEDKLVTEQRLQYEKMKYYYRVNDKEDTEYNRLIDKLNYTPLLKPKTILYKIMAGTPNWRDRYYYHHFNIKKDYKYIDENLLEVCHNYLEGIIWNTQYYFKECCCWDWHYSYLHAPTIKDLANNFEICMDKIDFKNSQKEPVKPFIQLLNVLPPQSSHLLPKSYEKLMRDRESDIYHYYPTKIKLDYYLNRFLHECDPMLPNIDMDLINMTTKDIQLTDIENAYNALHSHSAE